MHHPTKKTQVNLSWAVTEASHWLRKASRETFLTTKTVTSSRDYTPLPASLSKFPTYISYGNLFFSLFLPFQTPHVTKTLQPLTWPLCSITYISCTQLSRLGSNTLHPPLDFLYKLPIKPSTFVCYSLQPWGWTQQVPSNVSIHHYDYMASKPRRQ
jgi:hypothetical protein